MRSISFIQATDPLGHTAPLDFTVRLPLLGLPLEFRSNSPAVIAAAEQSFGCWRDLAPELIEPNDPLIVDLIVHPEDSLVTIQATRDHLVPSSPNGSTAIALSRRVAPTY